MTELANIVACFIVFGLYEMYLGWTTLRAPMKLARSAHAAIRSNWVKSVMRRPGTEILVIQTLRNSVMAASFMATTAILALSGTLTLSGIANSDNRLWQAAHEGSRESMLFAAKLLLLTGSFFVSFLFMAMAVRFFNHAGYLITGEVASEESNRKETLAAAYLNRAGNYYSLGMRAFFTCIPFLAGLFSTYLMFPATCILVLILYWFDRIPSGE
jgi:uncharacterized membrane protein